MGVWLLLLVTVTVLPGNESLAQSTPGVTSATVSQAEQNYSSGLAAYLDADYRLAQTQWLAAAKQGHAKAMFNLGLLHQQGKLPAADTAKAERWFRLAGQNGYAAADFHLAKWLEQRSASPDQINRHLNRAAENQFYPARKTLGQSNTSVSDTKVVPTQTKASTSNVSTSNVSTSPEDASAGTALNNDLSLRYQGPQWIRQQGATYWTIQILAFKERARVEEFIDQHRLHQRAAYFVERSNEGALYKLVYGSFISKEAADQARQRLKPALQQHGPWLRTFASVQSVLD